MPPIDLMKIAPISAVFSSEPLPRITNDMLPRGTTLPPALALLLLDGVHHVAQRQAVALAIAPG